MAYFMISYAQVKEFRWGTSATGSSGHRALVALITVLQKEMPNYNFTVLPTPGAVHTVKQYAMEEMEGLYGADVAFFELAGNRDRFEGFDTYIKRQPVQSFWAYTLEVGLAIHARDIDKYKEWRDLTDQSAFTGPAGWDVRAALDRALEILGVDYEYVEIDTGMVASSLNAGHITAFNAYTSGGGSSVPPWIMEAELGTDIAILNPSEEEIAILSEAGIDVVEVPVDAFETNVHVDKIIRVPFFYGFHTGPEVMSEEEVYQMLKIIEEKTDELVMQDPIYKQIQENMVDIQLRGVKATIDFVPVHPGLAKYLQEKGIWNPEWNDRIAK
jgi:hypothetical protein